MFEKFGTSGLSFNPFGPLFPKVMHSADTPIHASFVLDADDYEPDDEWDEKRERYEDDEWDEEDEEEYQ